MANCYIVMNGGVKESPQMNIHYGTRKERILTPTDTWISLPKIPVSVESVRFSCSMSVRF